MERRGRGDCDGEERGRERRWSGDGAEMERRWSRDGAEMERRWRGDGVVAVDVVDVGVAVVVAVFGIP